MCEDTRLFNDWNGRRNCLMQEARSYRRRKTSPESIVRVRTPAFRHCDFTGARQLSAVFRGEACIGVKSDPRIPAPGPSFQFHDGRFTRMRLTVATTKQRDQLFASRCENHPTKIIKSPNHTRQRPILGSCRRWGNVRSKDNLRTSRTILLMPPMGCR
jgi:hypothetical protein